MTKLYLTLLLVSVALFMYSCESVTNSVPQDEEILSQEMTLDGSAQTKVDVCHYDAETDAYELITIADPAVDAHINHGDAQPGDAVPTMEGFEFDDSCTPKPIVIEISACFANALNGLKLNPGVPADLTLEDNEWFSLLSEYGTLIGSSLLNGTSITLLAQSDLCFIQYKFENGSTYGLNQISDNFEDDSAYMEYLLTL